MGRYRDIPGGGGPDSTLSQSQLDEINERIGQGLVDPNMVADFVYVEEKKPRLVMVSGPSGAGKGKIIDLAKELSDFFQFKVRKRGTERHLGTEDDLGWKGWGKYMEFECRNDLQRLYYDELSNALQQHSPVLIEAYYKIFDFMKERYSSWTNYISVFISPFSPDEIEDSVKASAGGNLADIMLNTLIERAQKMGKSITSKLARELENRAEDVFNELRFCHNYDYVIANHCYEGDPGWNINPLIGEAKRSVDTLVEIVRDGKSAKAYRGADYLCAEKL